MIADQAARERALDPTQSFIVQAPAGSGKTELLVGRYLRLLATVNFPEEIIAITFTRKAASEMLARVFKALEAAQQAVMADTEHGKRLMALAKAALERSDSLGWQILENPSRLRVTTIDSLCASITAQLPMTAHFGEHFSVTDRPDRLYREAISQLVRGLSDDLPFNDDIRRVLLYLDNRMDVFEQLLVDMLARREMWLDIVVSASQHHDLKARLDSAREDLVEERLAAAHSIRPAELIKPIQILLRYAKGDELGEEWSLADYQSVAKFLLTDAGTLRKMVDKRQGFLPKTPEKEQMVALLNDCGQYPEFVSALSAMRILPTHTFTDASWEITQSLLTVLQAAAAYCQVIFKSTSEVDFNEIALLALKSLGDEDQPTDIMLRLDYRLTHLLVDEYQDTSLLQYRLLNAIVRGWEPGDGRTLFCVGDPMQSIYRFRQAEVGLFLKTIEKGIGPVSCEFIQLTSNFRSSPSVVEWVNKGFKEIFPVQSDEMIGAVAYSASTAVQSELSEGVQVSLCDSRVAEVNQIVEKISQARSADPTQHIAVLVRARTHLSELLPALRAARIPYQGVDIDVLSNRFEVMDCLSLTYALYDDADDVSMMALCRSPLFGFTLADMLQVAQHQGEHSVYETLFNEDLLPHLSEHARAMLLRQLPHLAHARTLRYRVSLVDVVKSVWLMLGGPATLDDEAALDNVEQFFALLAQCRPRHRLPKRENLEEDLARLFAKPTAEHANPVSVMTIHKAKGLEFDVVICPMLGRSSARLEKPLLLWQDRDHEHRHELLIAPHAGSRKDETPMYRFLYELEKERTRGELARLFYVAVTRAKKACHLIAEVPVDDDGQPKRARAGSLLQLLWPVIDTDSLVLASAEDDNSIVSRARFAQLPANYAQTLQWPAPIEREDTNQPDVPQTFSPDERAFGTVVHRYLQWLAESGTQSIEQSTLWAPIAHRLKQEGCIEVDLYTAKVWEALAQTLADKTGQWILQTHEQAACELALIRLRHGKVCTDIIDRTFIADGIRWVIDYKLGEPEVAEAYEQQLTRYARAIHAHDKGQYPVKCMLYFPLHAKRVELASISLQA